MRNVGVSGHPDIWARLLDAKFNGIPSDVDIGEGLREILDEYDVSTLTLAPL